MKLFFLIAALFVVGTTAQTQNVPADIQAIINDLSTNASAVVDSIVSAWRLGVNALQSALVASWNVLKVFLQSSLSPVSQAYVDLLQAAVNTTIDVFNNNFASSWLRNATIQAYQNAQASFNVFLQEYAVAANISSGIYQCWNVSRPQIVQTLKTFTDSTLQPSRQLVDNFNSYALSELGKVTANFTSYQLAAPWCFSFNRQTSINCKNAYWNSVTPQIQAAFNNYRSNILTERNATIQALDSLVSTNAQTARTSLQAIDTQFDTCVNNTLTTTAAPTTVAP